MILDTFINKKPSIINRIVMGSSHNFGVDQPAPSSSTGGIGVAGAADSKDVSINNYFKLMGQ
jgi:hypothetical protein